MGVLLSRKREELLARSQIDNIYKARDQMEEGEKNLDQNLEAVLGSEAVGCTGPGRWGKTVGHPVCSDSLTRWRLMGW